MRAAHHWSVQHEPDLAMRLAAALYWYVEAGSSTEVALWAQQSAAVAGPSHPLLPLVLAVAGWGASKRGDLSGATEYAHRALAASGDQDPVGRYAHYVLGDVALFEGRLDAAIRCYQELARLAHAAGDAYSYACAVVNAALPLAYGSDDVGAVAAARGARSVAVATRFRFLEGVALVSAASLRARHGDPQTALRLFGDVIDHWQRAGNWTQQWITLRKCDRAARPIGRRRTPGSALRRAQLQRYRVALVRRRR